MTWIRLFLVAYCINTASTRLLRPSKAIARSTDRFGGSPLHSTNDVSTSFDCSSRRIPYLSELLTWRATPRPNSKPSLPTAERLGRTAVQASRSRSEA